MLGLSQEIKLMFKVVDVVEFEEKLAYFEEVVQKQGRGYAMEQILNEYLENGWMFIQKTENGVIFRKKNTLSSP
jgi:hypothetical protein